MVRWVGGLGGGHYVISPLCPPETWRKSDLGLFSFLHSSFLSLSRSLFLRSLTMQEFKRLGSGGNQTRSFSTRTWCGPGPTLLFASSPLPFRLRKKEGNCQILLFVVEVKSSKNLGEGWGEPPSLTTLQQMSSLRCSCGWPTRVNTKTS